MKVIGIEGTEIENSQIGFDRTGKWKTRTERVATSVIENGTAAAELETDLQPVIRILSRQTASADLGMRVWGLGLAIVNVKYGIGDFRVKTGNGEPIKQRVGIYPDEGRRPLCEYRDF